MKDLCHLNHRDYEKTKTTQSPESILGNINILSFNVPAIALGILLNALYVTKRDTSTCLSYLTMDIA